MNIRNFYSMYNMDFRLFDPWKIHLFSPRAWSSELVTHITISLSMISVQCVFITLFRCNRNLDFRFRQNMHKEHAFDQNIGSGSQHVPTIVETSKAPRPARQGTSPTWIAGHWTHEDTSVSHPGPGLPAIGHMKIPLSPIPDLDCRPLDT
ncbi:hypothetical protein MAR_013607 [Mya arenaria]|uniref:Uncharacterized protein n=1 Tax=Mya arenaria TaxID=6604 RepID=A0ABY7G0B6_MYAAR|nr:hypothetical protein MAR_013607 [Mya arenaria]